MAGELTSSAQQSSINSLQTNLNTVNNGLTAAQNDITSLQNTIGNIPVDITQEIANINTKNEQQDTAIATAQSEANTATETAQEAINKISLLKMSDVFNGNASMTINNASYDVTLGLFGTVLSINGDPAMSKACGYISISGLPDALRVSSPAIGITITTKTNQLANQLEQMATVNMVLASTLHNYLATITTPPSKQQFTIQFYVDQTVSGATISNIKVYF